MAVGGRRARAGSGRWLRRLALARLLLWGLWRRDVRVRHERDAFELAEEVVDELGDGGAAEHGLAGREGGGGGGRKVRVRVTMRMRARARVRMGLEGLAHSSLRRRSRHRA